MTPGVTVGDNVSLRHCIIGAGCVVPAGVSMGARCLLASGVELAPAARLEDGARVVSALEDDWGEDGDDAGDDINGDALGPKAFLYNADDDEEDDEDDIVGLTTEAADPWGEMFVTDQEEDDSSDEDSEDENDMDDDGLRDDAEESDDGEHDDVKNFRREVMDSILRGLEQGVAPDNLVLEINGSKHAWNTTLSEVNQCVLYSVLTANIDLDTDSAKTILPAVIKNINKLTQLLVKYSK